VECREGVPRHECDATLSGVAQLNKSVTNIAASVHQRLLNLARDREEDFKFVLTKYALERVLFRISQSKHENEFVLKGALLFGLWTEKRYRPTRDADFLARGENSLERLCGIFKEICSLVVVDDGFRFDLESVRAERIREDADYEGIRVKFEGYLGKAEVPVRIDVGFGDVITPEATKVDFPSMLGFPKPSLLAYPKETVVAEKFEAMVKLGIVNTRMKDFHDLRSLCQEFHFDGRSLSEAVEKTFIRRRTPLPAKVAPIVFSAEFFEDENKKRQWSAFCRKYRGYVNDASLESICLEIARFLMPVVEFLNNKKSFDRSWAPKGPWD
jgi:hypothetical protein